MKKAQEKSYYKIDFKNHRCCYCKSKKNKKTIYNRVFIKKFFQVCVCDNCGFQYTNLIPKNKTSFINLYKLGGVDDKSRKNIFKFMFLFFHKLRIFQLHKINKIIAKYITSKKNLLDFGTGDGYLAEYFFNRGFKVFASDIDVVKPKFLNKKIIYLKNNKLNKNKFDVIVLRHVLEHTENPLNLIEKLKIKLKKNGFFYIEIPNHDIKTNFFLKIFKQNYCQLGLPFHINHFSLKLIMKLFSKNYEIYTYKMEIPVLGKSISNIFIKQDSNLFTFLNILLFPIQLLINFLMSKNSAFSIIMKKK